MPAFKKTAPRGIPAVPLSQQKPTAATTGTTATTARTKVPVHQIVAGRPVHLPAAATNEVLVPPTQPENPPTVPTPTTPTTTHRATTRGTEGAQHAPEPTLAGSPIGTVQANPGIWFLC